MSLSYASIYGANTAGLSSSQTAAVAPDPTNMGRVASSTQPAMSWITILALLVAVRVLQEMAD